MLQLVLILFLLIPGSARAGETFKEFPQWQRVLKQEQFKPPSSLYSGDVYKLIQIELKKYKDFDYADDYKNYHVNDLWSTREEFIKAHSGDCEDFAIAWYYDLLEAGIVDKDMEIVVVMINRTHALHAVLRVQDWYMDSLADGIRDRSSFDFYYTRIYGINRTGWSK